MKKFICWLFGHKWNGCTCVRCGKRDWSSDDHEWKSCVCEKCSLSSHDWEGCKCKKCGETRSVEDEYHDWEGCVCKRCNTSGNHDWRGCKCERCGITRQHNYEKKYSCQCGGLGYYGTCSSGPDIPCEWCDGNGNNYDECIHCGHIIDKRRIG